MRWISTGLVATAGALFWASSLTVAAQTSTPGTAAKSETPAPAKERVQVRLVVNHDGGISVAVQGNQPVFVTDLREGNSPRVIGGVRLSLAPNGRAISIGGAGKEVVVEAEGFAGWAARVPDKNQCLFDVDTKRVILDLTTPPDNAEGVAMRFADGAKAEMKPGSFARFDLFKDESYYFSAFGKVSAVNADGLAMELSTYRPPLTGGPLRQTTDAKGASRMERRTPAAEVRIGGGIPEDLGISIGLTNIILPMGQRQTVILTNGAMVEFTYNSVRKRLDWRIEKGYFKFSLDGFQCWRAAGLTDQEAGHQWDAGTKSVETHNHSPQEVVPPNKVVLNYLNRSTLAGVYPQAIFQYVSIVNCHTYSASSYGGKVVLYNNESGTETVLGTGNLLVQPSNLNDNRTSTGSRRQITLNWDTGTPVLVSGALGSSSVVPSSEQTLSGRGDDISQLMVRNADNGSVTVSAVGGNFVIHPSQMDNWSINIDEGDSVTLTIDMRRGIFVASTSRLNGSDVRIATSEGFSPLLTADTTVTFILGRNQSYVASSQSSTVFFEASGSPVSFDNPNVAPPGTPGLTGRGMPGPPSILNQGGTVFSQVSPPIDLSKLTDPRIFLPPASTK